MKFNTLIILGIIGVLAVFIANPLSITGSTPTLQHYNINTNTLTPGYKLGTDEVVLNTPSFTCEDREGIVKYPADRTCWEMRINDEITQYGDDIVRQGYTLKATSVTATAFCEEGNCEILSSKDHRATYDLIIDANPTTLEAPVGAFHSILDTPLTTSFLWDNQLPSGIQGGINVITKSRILQQEDSFVVEGKLDERFDIELKFDEIGQHIIQVQPFITVYDYNKDFVNEDTGLCGIDTKTSESFCVQTTRLPIGEPVIFDVYTSPDACNVEEDCGGGFDCIGGTCSLNVEGNRTIFDFLVLWYRQLVAFIGGLF